MGFSVSKNLLSLQPNARNVKQLLHFRFFFRFDSLITCRNFLKRTLVFQRKVIHGQKSSGRSFLLALTKISLKSIVVPLNRIIAELADWKNCPNILKNLFALMASLDEIPQ